MTSSKQIWHFLGLLVALLFFYLILVNLSTSIIRSLSIALRNGFGIAFFLSILFIYITYRIHGQIGELLAFISTMVLFSLGLAGLWISGNTQPLIMNGLIPISDATIYYVDALKILNGGDVSDFTAMRPFFTGFLSVLLWLTDRNLLFALGILTAIAGISAFLSSREIQKTHGAETSIFFLALIFLYYRHHSGSTMSESLAVPISLLGITMIWKSISNQNEKYYLFGLALLTIALNIRPGAMFVLIGMLIFGGFFFNRKKSFSINFFIISFIVIVCIFSLNKLVIYMLAGPGKNAFSNFSWALYGLVSGGQSWNYIFTVHPEVLSENSNSAIYRLIIEQFFKNPLLTVQGALKYWEAFFSDSWYNAYAFVAGENYWINEVARWGIYILSIIGIINWMINRNNPYTILAITGALGVITSVPFVPPTDAYRVRLYAATIPFFVLLPAMGVSLLQEKLLYRINKNFLNQYDDYLTIKLSISLLIAIVIAPIILKNTVNHVVISEFICPSDMDASVIKFDQGTYINVRRENQIFLDFMPNFHVSAFRESVHSLADPYLIEKMVSINIPSTLLYTLDLLSNQEVLVIINSNELPNQDALLYLCGYWESDPRYSIFEADIIVKIE